jgi:large subunit ribosomal protein L25
MSNAFELNATVRSDLGKGASRRLRRLAEMVPAIIYGEGKPAVNISIPHKDIQKALTNEAFYSHILTLKMSNGADEKVVLKAMQRHPVRPLILHVDFLRIDENEELTLRVPIHFINEASCPAVKNEGGVVSHLMSDIEVLCLPKDLPEYIVVDLAEVKLNETNHIGDLKLPAGVRSAAIAHGGDPMLPVVAIHAPRGGADATPAA